MPKTRSEILIKKVFEFDFTWADLENYFNINRKFLLEDLKIFLQSKPNFNLKLKKICDRLKRNEVNQKKEIIPC